MSRGLVLAVFAGAAAVCGYDVFVALNNRPAAWVLRDDSARPAP